MRVAWTKASDARHRIQVARDDGSTDEQLLESRSLLLHDFVHFALEGAIGSSGGVFGRLAAGASLASLGDPAATPLEGELLVIEQLVGPLQALVHERMERSDYLRLAQSQHPGRMNEPLLDEVLQRVRALRGEWRKLPFGAAMTHTWPPSRA